MAPSNTLPTYGNEKTMNLNPLVLTNIQSSPYFKVNLFELKTYHEVIDEIYYKVNHLEPWEKGSRKTAGQTGMCGGVRGVGAGGIVSSAFCLLYKLYTLKLTRKQLQGLLNHADSPYIRGLGFMYIRFSQPPADFWEWFSPYLEDDEEIDVKAGGGHTMLMGEMVRQFLTKLDWYATLFPRIPVPVQKDLEVKLRNYDDEMRQQRGQEAGGGAANDGGGWGGGGHEGEGHRGGDRGRGDSVSHRASDHERDRKRQRSRSRSRGHRRSRSAERRRRSKSRDRKRSKSRDRTRRRSHDRDKRHRSRSRDRHRHGDNSSSHRSSHRRSRDKSADRSSHHRSRDERHASPPRDRHARDKRRDNHREDSFERDLARERERQKRDRDRRY